MCLTRSALMNPEGNCSMHIALSLNMVVGLSIDGRPFI